MPTRDSDSDSGTVTTSSLSSLTVTDPAGLRALVGGRYLDDRREVTVMHPEPLVVSSKKHAIARVDFGTALHRDAFSPKFASSLPLLLTESVEGCCLAVGR